MLAEPINVTKTYFRNSAIPTLLGFSIEAGKTRGQRPFTAVNVSDLATQQEAI